MQQLVRVDVTDEYLQKLISNPAQGLIELIENALDAEADEVVVHFKRGALEAITDIEVRDDGDGITPGVAVRSFGQLGNSWKAAAGTSRSGRTLRGSQGHGRWAAFALGDNVVWSSVSEGRDQFLHTSITGRRSKLGQFEIDDEPIDAHATKTIVRITDVTEKAQTLDGDAAREKLTLHFALYLQKHPGVQILIDKKLIDPSEVQRHRSLLNLDRQSDSMPPAGTELFVIEWLAKVKEAAKPRLVLCDMQGEALAEITGMGLPVSPFPYTAYLKCPIFEEHRGFLPVLSMAPEPLPSIFELARSALREYVASRLSEARTALVKLWKSEHSYPYEGTPINEIDKAERELFDLVAVTAAPALQSTDPRARKFSLRLIQEALQRDPTQMARILEEVLGLSDDDVAQLNDLLTRTSLSSIIGTAKMVAHRLDVIDGLSNIIHDREISKVILERKHLHEIVAAEPWVFGDEYAVSVSDRNLTEVLRAHRKMLDDDRSGISEETAIRILDDGEPVLLEGRQARVDLLMSRTIENATNRYDHLVVELKRPSVKIGSDEITQIEKYAFRIAKDGRFIGQDVSWTFLLIGADLDEYAKMKRGQDGIVHRKDNMVVRLIGWGELLGQCKHRLKTIQRELKLATREDAGVEELQRLHETSLPGLLRPAGPRDENSPIAT